MIRAMSPDDKLDETIEETFPASDAPANTGETGVRVRIEADAEPAVIDNAIGQRFELTIDGQTAFMKYERRDDALVLVHTEVPPSLRGGGVGERLVVFALDSARARRLRVVAVCPFVRAYLRRHPEAGIKA